MSDHKSKLPDISELGSMATKFLKDMKVSLDEIIHNYKQRHQSHERTQSHTAASPEHAAVKKTPAKRSTTAKKATPKVTKEEQN